MACPFFGPAGPRMGTSPCAAAAVGTVGAGLIAASDSEPGSGPARCENQDDKIPDLWYIRRAEVGGCPNPSTGHEVGKAWGVRVLLVNPAWRERLHLLWATPTSATLCQ